MESAGGCAFLAVLALLAAGVELGARWYRRRWWRRLEAFAADRPELQVGRPGDRRALHGELDGVEVSLELPDVLVRQQETSAGTYTWLRLRDPRGLPAGTRIGPEAPFTDPADEGDRVLGDPAFDEAVDLRGAAIPLLARLDAPARQRIVAAVGDGWHARDGAWVLPKGAYLRQPESLAHAIEEGLALCRALRREGTDAELLARAVRTDPCGEVRRRALREGLQARVLSKELAATVAAEDDSLAAVLAARELGDDQALARLLTVDDAQVRAEAAVALGTRVERGRATAPEVALRSALVDALEREGTVDRAIALLHELGTVAEVPPLKVRTAGLLPSDRRRRATFAVRAIQLRAEGAEHGQVSLAPMDATDGAVSVAAAPRAAGRLSNEDPHSS